MPASLPPRQGWHLPVVSAKLAEMSEETNYFAGKTPPRLPLGLQTFQSCLMLFPARSGHAFAEVAASCGGSVCKTGSFAVQYGLSWLSKRPVSASRTGRLPMAVAERAPYGWLTAAWECCLVALPVGGCAIAVRRAMTFASTNCAERSPCVGFTPFCRLVLLAAAWRPVFPRQAGKHDGGMNAKQSESVEMRLYLVMSGMTRYSGVAMHGAMRSKAIFFA